MNSNKNILNLLHHIVKTNPSAICLEKNNIKMTYEIFWEQCNMYANNLIRKTKFKVPVVCILEEKNFFDYIAMIGTLISGGYYIPINRITPKEKIINIINDTGANFFSSNNKKIINIKKKNFNFVNQRNIERRILPVKKKYKNSILAYILFTSGTTGKPKGVMIKKTSLNHYTKWLVNKFKLNINDNCSQIPSIGFDLSLADIFLSLCSGSKLIIPDTIDQLFPSNWFYKKKINHIVCTPSLIDYINSSKKLTKKNFSHIKSIFFCGEPLYLNHVKSLFNINKKLKIVNAYGPTEAACSMTTFDINIKNYREKSLTSMSIGKPIPGMKVKIFNTDKTKNNKVGEILISGKQLSIGYLKQEKLTNEKFIKLSDKIYYKTGDWGCIKNNELYFLSRIDNQIKIKGFRVELNEIDYYLRKFGLNNPKSIFINGKIISFVVSKKINEKKIKEFLINELEVYKIPSNIIDISNIPLNKNGKVDIDFLKKYYIKNEV